MASGRGIGAASARPGRSGSGHLPLRRKERATMPDANVEQGTDKLNRAIRAQVQARQHVMVAPPAKQSATARKMNSLLRQAWGFREQGDDHAD